MAANRYRRIFAALIFVAVFAVFAGKMANLQIAQGSTYRAESNAVSQRTVSVSAARGEIVDRYGTALVENHQGYALVFDGAYFPTPSEQEERDKIIISLIRKLEASGEGWNNTLPLEIDADGKPAYMADREADIKKIKREDLLNLNDYATAQNCFDALVSRYKLEEYTPEEALKIGSVCLAMKEIGFGISTPYTFADDVSERTVAAIKENSLFYRGVDVEVVPYRDYADGTVAPHLLGTVGFINAEEYAEKKDDGYAITDDIGKSGIEYAMEAYLRGKPGVKTVYTDASGNVTGSEITKDPEQGNTVVLTIDSGLQKVAQEALAQAINDYAVEKGNIVTPAGAVVAMDCNTGEILCSASYPTYNIANYYDDYTALSRQTGDPLWNRALQSSYAPGSTMKPSVACAALETGLIDENYTVYCYGKYIYLGQEFKCEQAHASPYVNVVRAIQESCNTFFYEVGKNLGITKMNEYRVLFGFGQKTGVEVSEATGVLDSPEYRESLNQPWMPGYTVQSAIGQAGNLVSPVQLCNYCATIANGGTRYNVHLVKSVLKYDNSGVVIEKTPEIVNKVGLSQKTLDLVREGMHRLCKIGYCRKYFSHLKSSIDPSGKTGTSQEYRKINGKSTKINNGFFISFAPYDEPQIAVAVVGEGMTSGTYVAPVAAAIYEYYFSEGEKPEAAQTENTLIG
ncbi:MAG: hypothetical protein IJK60_00105 [Clostridia bacterium]|nr:hypothetical protein [Clostridia bacterium]